MRSIFFTSIKSDMRERVIYVGLANLHHVEVETMLQICDPIIFLDNARSDVEDLRLVQFCSARHMIHDHLLVP